MTKSFAFDLVVNGVIWISAPREGEGGVTRRILEDLEPIVKKSGLSLDVHEVQSLQDLERLLQQIANNARIGSAPLIHFDMHGSKEHGLEIGATGEHLCWQGSRAGFVPSTLRPATIFASSWRHASAFTPFRA
jgi:hypothetical protein